MHPNEQTPLYEMKNKLKDLAKELDEFMRDDNGEEIQNFSEAQYSRLGEMLDDFELLRGIVEAEKRASKSGEQDNELSKCKNGIRANNEEAR